MAKTPSPTSFTAPERGPARAALAAVIQRREAMKADLAAAEAAVVAAEINLNVTSAALARADEIETRSLPFDEAQAKRRRDHQAGYRRSSEELALFDTLQPVPLSTARSNLAVARDEQHSSYKTLQDAKARLRALQPGPLRVSCPVDDAAKRAALADPAYASLRREAVRLERAARDAHAALALFGTDSRIKDDDLGALALSLPIGERSPLRDAWEAALQRLANDADAILPG